MGKQWNSSCLLEDMNLQKMNIFKLAICFSWCAEHCLTSDRCQNLHLSNTDTGHCDTGGEFGNGIEGAEQHGLWDS